MLADDEAKLAHMLADLERIRKLLRDSDRQAEPAVRLLIENDASQPANCIPPENAKAIQIAPGPAATDDSHIPQ